MYSVKIRTSEFTKLLDNVSIERQRLFVRHAHIGNGDTWIKSETPGVIVELRLAMLGNVGELVSIGYHRLGYTRYDYYQCATCKTDFPVINGNISCNSRAITVCPYC
jgi:hypothetical protein